MSCFAAVVALMVMMFREHDPNKLFVNVKAARLAAEELAKATRTEVVQVIGSKFVLYRETHSKPKEKRIQLVKPSVKKKVVKG